MRRGRSQQMGLGGSDVSLALARERAADARKELAHGRNPIEVVRQTRVERPTFGEIAEELMASRETAWCNAKHRAQWAMTLERYCKPLTRRPVDEIDTGDVLAVLKPLWARVPETASRVRGRIEAVLDAARAREHIEPHKANPARWRGHLDKLLSKRPKLTRGHHPAMPFADLPAFMTRLRARKAVSALALEFAILTAARTGEIVGARWSEINFESRVWTIPASRMKGGREHRVPLSRSALAVLKKLDASRRVGEFIFPGARPGSQLSGMSMAMQLRRLDAAQFTVHGFRSSFRDWAGDASSFPREVAEAALAHVLGNEVERAYRRGDALEKRRELMEAWARHCEPRSGNVVQIRHRR
jgi:integrase